jgi:hypothetical protein
MYCSGVGRLNTGLVEAQNSKASVLNSNNETIGAGLVFFPPWIAEIRFLETHVSSITYFSATMKYVARNFVETAKDIPIMM